MKARKDYENGRVVVSVESGDKYYSIQFQGEKEMRMLGECLIDLARCGGKEVEIKEKDAVTQQWIFFTSGGNEVEIKKKDAVTQQ